MTHSGPSFSDYARNGEVQGVPQAQPKPKKRAKVEPEAGGQLEQFLIANKRAYDDAVMANEAADEMKASIKAWLLSLYEDRPDEMPDAFDITADPHGRYPAYTMTLKSGMRLDTELIREAGLYERFAKPTRPSWDLRQATAPAHRKK